MPKAATDGDDRPGLQWSLVDFHQQVEVGEGIVCYERALEEGVVVWRESVFEVFK